MNAYPKTRSLPLGKGLSVGGNGKLLIIAGPCQIESREHALMLADKLQQLTAKFPVHFVYKSSYDKANRTSAASARGVGLERGLEILSAVREKTGAAVLTDVHTAAEVPVVAAAADILQIPAFLCRQTDLLLAAGTAGKPVNIKKGQFLHPEDMKFAAEKVASTGNQQILLCERGSSFGYRDLVVDMRGLIMMKESGYPVIFDATHSVQQLGGADGKSGGHRKFIFPLIRAAVATGVDGIFMECHENPDTAPSDAKSMLPLSQMEEALRMICTLRETYLTMAG